MATYLNIVQIRKQLRFSSPGSRGLKLKDVCLMTLAINNLGRFFDRIAPALLLFLGLTAAGATAALGA
jgi:hypothetical protein